MNSEIDELLDHVDGWKLKLHEELKDMSPAQRMAFWNRIHEEARTRGLNVVEPAKRPSKRVRQTGKDTKKRISHET
jgi:hypothetical protein